MEIVRTKRNPIYVQNLACPCGTTKSVKIEPTGYVKGVKYDYPEDYKLKGRNTKKRNAQMRRLYINGIR